MRREYRRRPWNDKSVLQVSSYLQMDYDSSDLLLAYFTEARETPAGVALGVPKDVAYRAVPARLAPG